MADPLSPQSLAAQNTYWQALKDRVLPQQAQGLLGPGMAQQAAAILQSRPYQLHVQEARALGQTPLTPEQFMATQRGLLPGLSPS
jgi:hypothetical protein